MRGAALLLLVWWAARARCECDPRTVQVGSGTTSYCANYGGGFGDANWGNKDGKQCYNAQLPGQACPCSCVCKSNVPPWCAYKCVSEYDNNKQFCYQTTQTCEGCAAGYQRTGCGCNADWTVCTGGTCTQCAAGQYNSGAPASRCAACSACARGQRVTQACTAGTDTVCATCPAGSYCQDPASTAAEECPIGSYCPAGSTAPIACVHANGERCPTKGLSAARAECDAGFRLVADSSTRTKLACSPCDAGTFTNSIATEVGQECLICPSGKYQPSTGAIGCRTCGAGNFTGRESGATACALCPAGEICVTGNCVSCTGCKENTYSPGGASACLICKDGLSVNGARTACVPCAVGTYSEGGVPCDACPAGFSTASGPPEAVGENVKLLAMEGATAKEACWACPVGFYLRAGPVPATGNLCAACSADEFCAGDGAPPVPCNRTVPAGFYAMTRCGPQQTQVNVACITCGEGQFELLPCNGTHPRVCKDCTVCASATAIEFNFSTATPCGANGDAACVKCDTLNSSDVGKGARCNPCPPGTAGAACAQCEAGTFSAGGGGACQPCPANRTSGPGAARCTALCASADTYAPDGEGCIPLSTAEQQVVAWDPVLDSYGLSALAQLPPQLDAAAAGAFLAVHSPPGVRGQLVLVGQGMGWVLGGNTQLALEGQNYSAPKGVWQDATECIFANITSLTVGAPALPTTWTALLTEGINGTLRLLKVADDADFIPRVQAGALALTYAAGSPPLLSPVDAFSMEEGVFLVVDQLRHALYELRLSASGIGGALEQVTDPKHLQNPSAITGLPGGDRVLVLDGSSIFNRSQGLIGVSNWHSMTKLCGSVAGDPLLSLTVGKSFAPMAVNLLNAVDIAVAGGRCWVLLGRGGVLVWDFQSLTPVVLVVSVTAEEEASFRFSAFSTDGSLYLSAQQQWGAALVKRLDWQGGCQCDPGLYCLAGRHCVQAPAGSYTAGWASAPVPCAAGYGGLTAGASSAAKGCLRCPWGFTTVAAGSAQCVRACPAGKFYHRTTGACVDGCNASLGLFLDNGLCAQCPLGSGAVDGDRCELCGYGWHGASPGLCAPCPANTSTFDRGATRCMPLTAGDDGSPALPAAFTIPAAATAIAASSGGDAVYVGAGALLWRLAAGASQPAKLADWSAAPTKAGVSARGYFGMLQVNEAHTTLYAAARGGSCVYAVPLAAGGGLLPYSSKPLAGDCERASHQGVGLLGELQSMALGEVVGHTPVLFVSSIADGCSALFGVSTHDGALKNLASTDPTQFPTVFLPSCVQEPLILATQRGALYVAWGARIFAAQAMGPNRKLTSGFLTSELLELTSDVVGLAVQPGYPLLAVTSDARLHVFPAGAFNADGSEQQGVVLQGPFSGGVASVGRRAWLFANGSSSSTTVRQVSLGAAGGCVGGFVPASGGLCMQAGLGHVVLASDSALRECPAGTFGNSTGAYSLGHCFPCPDGTVSSGDGATQCVACLPGEVASADGTKCLPTCAEGSYLGRARQCASCGVGFTSPLGGTAAANCRPCAAGEYSNASTDGRCLPCPAGFTSLQQSAHCVVVCPQGECAADGRSCLSLTQNFEVLSQIAMKSNMVSLTVDDGGGVFYTDGTVLQYYFDDCPQDQSVTCSKEGADLLPSSYSNVQDSLTDYTFSALAICNKYVEYSNARANCQFRRTLYLASLTYNSIYSMDVCSSNLRGMRVEPAATMDLVSGGLRLVAGVPRAGADFADGDFARARFNQPIELAITASCGVLFVSDFWNHRVRMLDIGAGVVSTALGSGLACASYGTRVACSQQEAGSCTAPNCASVQLPAGLGLSARGDKLYVAMHEESSVGVLSNPGAPDATFAYVCGFSQRNYLNGSVPMCNLGASGSKGCPLFRPFDVVSYSQDLYVGVTQGLTRVDLRTAGCEQIAGQYFGTQGGPGTDGVGPMTPAAVSGLKIISATNVPFRLALAVGTGILYFADLKNGAVRRILVQAQCTCPAGLAAVPGANSCYDNSPEVDSLGQLPPCRCGFFALPGDAACFRSCADVDAGLYGSTAAPCLSQQACPATTTSSAAVISKPPAWSFLQVAANPQPLSGIMSDWYGQSDPNTEPLWDAIFAQKSQVSYRPGSTPGRAPFGGEFVSLTFLPPATAAGEGCWAVEQRPALQPRRLLPGLWYPCKTVGAGSTTTCSCPRNVGAFGLDTDPAALLQTSWYSARWRAVNGGARAMSSMLSDDGCKAGKPVVVKLPNSLENFVRGVGGDRIQLWSRFVMAGVKGGGRDGCAQKTSGPCFEHFAHVQQSAPSSLKELQYKSDYKLCVAPPPPTGERTCYVGWPAHYACPDGYVWAPPNMSLSVLAGPTRFCAGMPPTSQPTCFSCLPGYYSRMDPAERALAGGPYSCKPCETGFFSARSGSASCLPCPANTYANGTGSTSCTRCPNGTTTNREGAWSYAQCTACPSGTGTCGPCQPGTYQSFVGQLVCLNAPAGTYTDTEASPIYTHCPAGTFQQFAGRASCNRCLLGQYTPAGVQGAVACVSCLSTDCPLVVDNACGVGCGLNKYWDAEAPLGYQCKSCPDGTLNPSDQCALGIEACLGMDPDNYPAPLGRYLLPNGSFAFCPDGWQADKEQNFEACVRCPAGMFSRNRETPGCVACPNGTFSAAEGTTNCTPCPPGSHSQNSGSSSCQPCPQGTFAPAAGFGVCLDCPAGVRGPVEGLTACSACEKGFFSNRSGSVDCPHPCAADKDLYVVPGGTACSVCVGGLVNATGGECDPCGLGMFSGRVNGERVCNPCPAGTANLDMPLCANATECCRACPLPNQYAASGSHCVEALEGHMPLPNGTGMQPCPRGTFRAAGMLQCVPCPPGEASSALGARACILCQPGFIAPGTGNAYCPQCEHAMVALQHGATACEACTPGTEGDGGDSCKACPANTYSSSGVCLPCTKMVSLAGASACSPCPNWTIFSPTGGDCVPCPPGRYMRTPDAGKCDSCPWGKFLPLPGGTSASNCTACPQGLVSTMPGQAACSRCPAGSVGVNNGTSCGPCAAGSFANGSHGMIACAPCRRGTFAALSGTGNCTACPPGTFTASDGSTRCTPCPVGTFASAAGSERCAPCTLELGFANETGLARCYPRRTRCEEGFFVVLANANNSASADDGCAQCMPCDSDQLAAMQQPSGTHTLLLNAQQLTSNAGAMLRGCPGTTTAPLFHCVPSVMPPGWYVTYTSVNKAGASSSSSSSPSAMVDPYERTQCQVMSPKEQALAAYVVGPSILSCFVGCLYGVSPSGVGTYTSMRQAFASDSPSLEDPAANLFYAEMLLYVESVCLPCPSAPCGDDVIGMYRPLVATGCGPPCLIPGALWADACAARPDGCVSHCEGLPAHAFFVSASATTGDSRGCSWRCEVGYHINETGTGCAPCALDSAAEVASFCGGTNMAMLPASQCFATFTKKQLCIKCKVVPLSFQPTWDPEVAQCVYPCFAGHFFVATPEPACVPCWGPYVQQNLLPLCGAGTYLDVDSCMANHTVPQCRPCAVSGELYSADTTSFTTSGGTRADGCRAICRAGFHTVRRSSGEYVDVTSPANSLGPNATDLSCVRCLPDDTRSCAAEQCYLGYRRVPSVPDGQPGSCIRCTTNDMCLPGFYAPKCGGNDTVDPGCQQCPRSLLLSSGAATRQFVPYAAMHGPNRNRVRAGLVGGGCPTACINNHVQRALDGECVPCASLTQTPAQQISGCAQLNGQPSACNFVFAHWNATPGLPWWAPDATPQWMQIQVARTPAGDPWQRAGLCWACPFGTATTADDPDLCVILPGFSVAENLPMALNPIPTLQEGLALVFREPQQPVPLGVFPVRRRLLAAAAVVDARGTTTGRAPDPRVYPFERALMRRHGAAIRPSRQPHGSRALLQADSSSSDSLVRLVESGLSPNASATTNISAQGAVLDDGGSLSPCPYGSYKPEAGGGACVTCPSFSSTTDSASVASTQCLCQFGSVRDPRTGVCSPCPADTYGPRSKPGAPCEPCPSGETTFGKTGQTACACKNGLLRQGAGRCALCPAGFYCLPCYDGDPPPCPRLVQCFAGSTSPAGSSSLGNCTCRAGEVRLERPLQPGAHYCSPLPMGAIVSPVYGTVVCGPGWAAVSYTPSGGVRECALCPAGHYAEASPYDATVAMLDAHSQPTCVPCPEGTYSGSKVAIGKHCCITCPAQQSTAAAGATHIANCSCPEGMGKTGELGGTCIGCSLRQFRVDGKCVDCPPNSIANAGASSVKDCACGKGFQLSAESNVCVPCPLGTFSRASSNAPCVQCPAGSTTLNTGSTTPHACGAAQSLCLTGYVHRLGLGCFKSSSS